jgi:hypothetical protein
MQHPEVKYPYNLLVRKSEGKRPFTKLQYRWKDIIKVDLKSRI